MKNDEDKIATVLHLFFKFTTLWLHKQYLHLAVLHCNLGGYIFEIEKDVLPQNAKQCLCGLKETQPKHDKFRVSF